MGYTHYWRQNCDFTDEQWSYAREFFHNLLILLPGAENTSSDAYDEVPELFNWDGTGEPEFTDEYVSFNGNQELDLDHETFRVNKVYVPNKYNSDSSPFDFCKTARKPYDVAVCAMMLMFNDLNGKFAISSDGDDPWSSEEWLGGRRLYGAIKTNLEKNGIETPNPYPRMVKIYDPDFLIITQENGALHLDPEIPCLIIDYDNLANGHCAFCGEELPQDGSSYCESCDVDWNDHTLDELRRKL